MFSSFMYPKKREHCLAGGKYLACRVGAAFFLTVLIFTSSAQPALLPYKPSGSPKMYYVPQLKAVPSFLESKSDTTVESSHSGIMQKLFKILFLEIFCISWLIVKFLVKYGGFLALTSDGF